MQSACQTANPLHSATPRLIENWYLFILQLSAPSYGPIQDDCAAFPIMQNEPLKPPTFSSLITGSNDQISKKDSLVLLSGCPLKMLWFFLVLALLLQPTFGHSPGAFIKPAPGSLDHDYSTNAKYELDDLMTIQWETDDANRGFDMILWQDETRKYETLSSRSTKFPQKLFLRLDSLTQSNRQPERKWKLSMEGHNRPQPNRRTRLFSSNGRHE